MPKVVLDTTVLVSAFLRAVPGGASFELLARAHAELFELYLSGDILEETARVLLTRKRIRTRYHYPDEAVTRYCQGLARLSTVISEVPDLRVVRDPADDKILACAVAVVADYLVTRDDDLLSLEKYMRIAIVTPETLLPVLREQR
jgi:uncharacterized protein